MESKELTKKETNFVKKADCKIIEDIWESYLFADELSFKEFLQLYQEKHIKKYGKELEF